MRHQVFNQLARLIPMNALSLMTGKAARWELPAPVQSLSTKAFVKAFGIDMSEAELALEDYATIEDVFTRRLKAGARPIASELCMPADGILSQSGPANNDLAIQAKGLSYSLRELMYGPQATDVAQLSWFATIYLAPHNYHRVHSPIGGTLKHLRYFPGELWPVNSPAVKWTPQLFTRNERLVFSIENEHGLLNVAMVGALNVGRITTPFVPDFASNAKLRRRPQGSPRILELERAHRIVPGQELGTFMLGSTVIIAFDEALAKRYGMSQALPSRPVRMGESLT